MRRGPRETHSLHSLKRLSISFGSPFTFHRSSSCSPEFINIQMESHETKGNIRCVRVTNTAIPDKAIHSPNPWMRACVGNYTRRTVPYAACTRMSVSVGIKHDDKSNSKKSHFEIIFIFIFRAFTQYAAAIASRRSY